MPLYEYFCADCQRNVEVLQRSPDAEAFCPECAGKRLEKQLSLPAAPSVRGGSSSSLPMAAEGASCGAPRCCGGGCNFD